MADIAELEVRVTDHGIEQANRKLGRLESAFSDAQAAIITFNQALGLVQTALGFFDRALGASIRAAAEQERAVAGLNAQLQAQGRYSTQFSQALQDQAAALQRVTTFADDAVTSAQAMLATFPKLGNDVIPRATEAALDLATALGTDVVTAAQTVGIALNDPAEGLARLSRLGVRFTDDQQKLIAGWVAQGEAVRAQTYVLDELSSRFGGRAAAAAQTFDGQVAQLGNTFGDLLEEIGNVIIRNEALQASYGLLKGEIESATESVKQFNEAHDAQIQRDSQGWLTLLGDAYRGVKRELIDLNPLLQVNFELLKGIAPFLGGVGSSYQTLKQSGVNVVENVRETNARVAEANRTGDYAAAYRAWRDSFQEWFGLRARRPGDFEAREFPPEDPESGRFSSALPDVQAASAFGGPGTFAPEPPPPYADAGRRETEGPFDYFVEPPGPFRPGDPNAPRTTGRSGPSPAELAQRSALGFAGAGSAAADAQVAAAEQQLRLLQEQLATAEHLAATDAERLAVLTDGEQRQLEAAQALDAARQQQLDADIAILHARQQQADLTAGERAEIGAQLDALERQKAVIAATGGEVARLTREFEQQRQQVVAGMVEQAQAIRDSVEPLEAVNREMARLRELAASVPEIGAILTPAVLDDYERQQRRQVEQTADGFDDLINATRRFGQDFSRTLAEALSPDGARVSFREFLSSLIADVNEFVIQKTLTDPILDAVEEGIIKPIQGQSGDRSIFGLLGDLGGGAFDALFGGGSNRAPDIGGPSDLGAVGDVQALGLLATSAESAGDALLRTAQTTEGGFSGMIDAIGSGFTDLFGSLGQGIANLFTSLFSSGGGGFNVGDFFLSIGKAAFGSIVGGVFGGGGTEELVGPPQADGTFHRGGIAHLFHAGGIRTGEVPAILEEGELVLPRALTRELLAVAARRGEMRRYHTGGLVDLSGPDVAALAEIAAPRRDRLVSGGASPARGGDTYNIHVTQNAQSLDPRTAAQLLQQQAPVLVGIIRRDIARGGGLATDVGQRGA